jgi:hypothetical protein
MFSFFKNSLKFSLIRVQSNEKFQYAPSFFAKILQK